MFVKKTKNDSSAVYLLGLVMPDASLSVLLARALADLTVNGDKNRRKHQLNQLDSQEKLHKNKQMSHDMTLHQQEAQNWKRTVRHAWEHNN